MYFLGEQLVRQALLVDRFSVAVDGDQVKGGFRALAYAIIGEAGADAERKGLCAHRDAQRLPRRPAAGLEDGDAHVGLERPCRIGHRRQLERRLCRAARIGCGQRHLLAACRHTLLGKAEAKALVLRVRCWIGIDDDIGAAGEARRRRAVEEAAAYREFEGRAGGHHAGRTGHFDREAFRDELLHLEFQAADRPACGIGERQHGPGAKRRAWAEGQGEEMGARRCRRYDA